MHQPVRSGSVGYYKVVVSIAALLRSLALRAHAPTRVVTFVRAERVVMQAIVGKQRIESVVIARALLRHSVRPARPARVLRLQPLQSR